MNFLITSSTTIGARGYSSGVQYLPKITVQNSEFNSWNQKEFISLNLFIFLCQINSLKNKESIFLENTFIYIHK